MIAKKTIRFQGINALEEKLKKNAKMSDVKQVVAMNGTEMTYNAQKNAPVDTGFLRRGIVLKRTQGGFSARAVSTADYSGYLEYGTRFMSKKPFLGPAYNKQKAIFKKDLERLFK